MKITQLVPQKYRAELITIFLDDGQTFKSHRSIAQNHELKEGDTLSLDMVEQLKQEEELREVLEYAALYLSLKDRTEEELTQKLRGRKFSVRSIHLTIEELKKRKLMNDASFAKNYVESKISTRATEQLKQELTQKGVGEELIQEAIHTVEMENRDIPSEEERAFQLLVKRGEQIRHQDSGTVYRRLHDYLSRRGFEQESIEAAFRRYKKTGGAHESNE